MGDKGDSESEGETIRTSAMSLPAGDTGREISERTDKDNEEGRDDKRSEEGPVDGPAEGSGMSAGDRERGGSGERSPERVRERVLPAGVSDAVVARTKGNGEGRKGQVKKKWNRVPRGSRYTKDERTRGKRQDQTVVFGTENYVRTKGRTKNY